MQTPVSRSLGNRISNMLVRGAVTLVNAANKLQTVQVSLLTNEEKDEVEHFEPYGFTSRPLPGAEAIVAFLDGDRSHGVVLVATDRRYRIANLQDGDVAVFDQRGHVIKLTASGIEITGDVTITGNITSTGSVTNNGKNIGSSHTHGGVQTGGGTTGPVS